MAIRRDDLDLASIGIVKVLDGGNGTTYPDMPWNPKPPSARGRRTLRRLRDANVSVCGLRRATIRTRPVARLWTQPLRNLSAVVTS
jgi:hypothetical protein